MRDLSADLLAWYDVHARTMPWRVPPKDRQSGKRPDPYQVWLSEVMLQQTTVAAVIPYFSRFTELWPTVGDLAAAEDAAVMAEWAGLGYYARARNLLKCARVIASDFNGEFPDDYVALLNLPGIGPYTASAIAAIAFDRAEAVVDGNVERVMSRLHDVHVPLPKAKPVLTAHAKDLTPHTRPGDYAQAVMDLGATICTPRSPACGICPWRPSCRANRAGTADVLPAKAPKRAKPIRHGTLYLARRIDGAWLLETRPDNGLLGGMLGWPGSDWVATDLPQPDGTPPISANWRDVSGEVRHTFTHFHLLLSIRRADVGSGVEPLNGRFLTPSQFRPSDLPTVMRKAFDLAQNA